MKTPSFWYKAPGLFSTILSPLAWFYERGEQILRATKKPQKFPVPLISIGNVVCGGAGKTPVALAIACLLQRKGKNVHFVTRGYKGRKQGPFIVDFLSDSFLDVGDEPLLLSSQAPTWISKNRPKGVQKSMEDGAQVIILDDGHQTTSLEKDLSFVVVDLEQKFGNEKVIPAGPLRENLKVSLDRADAYICIGGGDFSTSKSVFKAKIVPQPLDLPTHKVVAFCGLGFPQKFYSTLTNLGLELVDQMSFPDHYIYKNDDLAKLQRLADKKQAILITTRKDFVKIPSPWQKKIHVLDILIQFENEHNLYQYIIQNIPHLKE